jgi:acetyl-CoA synthetase
MPLSALFGPAALRPRLEAASPDVLVTDPDGLETLAALDTPLPEPVVVVTGHADRQIPDAAVETVAYDEWVAGQSASLEPVQTAPDDPAQLFFTSGTTGEPKGVLQPHRVVLGHQYVGAFARDYHPSDLLCHVGDLSWAGGFNNVLETWSIGAPLLKFGGRFDPERLLDLLETYDADLLMIPPTAMRGLMDLDRAAIRDRDIDLRVVAAGGERVTPDILRWAEETFDAFATTIWGQTECYGLGWPALGAAHREKLGTAGKPLPGFEAAILDEDGTELPPNTLGELAIGRRDNPTLFTEYLDMPAATAATRSGRWHLTGDLAEIDADGYVWIRGRVDDVIISSGYRLSPVEIESALTGHPAVEEAATVGVPDERKTNRIVAYVRVTADTDESDETRERLREHVRARLSAVQYPDEIRFVTTFPTTTTGKIRRTELRECDEEP